MTTDPAGRDEQRRHWQTTFVANPQMYGSQASDAGAYAVELFAGAGAREVFELGAGQGRDTQAFLRAGLTVVAFDYARAGLAELRAAATAAGVVDRLTTVVPDVRERLPLPDRSVDAAYSYMLFNMALTTPELDALVAEVRRVLRPSGLHVYTVRHTGDAHYRADPARRRHVRARRVHRPLLRPVAR